MLGESGARDGAASADLVPEPQRMVLVMRRRALRLSLRLLQAKVSWLTVVKFNPVGTKLSVSLRVKMVLVEKKLEVRMLMRKAWARIFPRMLSECVIVILMSMNLPKFIVLRALALKFKPPINQSSFTVCPRFAKLCGTGAGLIAPGITKAYTMDYTTIVSRPITLSQVICVLEGIKFAFTTMDKRRRVGDVTVQMTKPTSAMRPCTAAYVRIANISRVPALSPGTRFLLHLLRMMLLMNLLRLKMILAMESLTKMTSWMMMLLKTTLLMMILFLMLRPLPMMILVIPLLLFLVLHPLLMMILVVLFLLSLALQPLQIMVSLKLTILHNYPPS